MMLVSGPEPPRGPYERRRGQKILFGQPRQIALKLPLGDEPRTNYLAAELLVICLVEARPGRTSLPHIDSRFRPDGDESLGT
jgi:hypothetical protein